MHEVNISFEQYKKEFEELEQDLEKALKDFKSNKPLFEQLEQELQSFVKGVNNDSN